MRKGEQKYTSNLLNVYEQNRAIKLQATTSKKKKKHPYKTLIQLLVYTHPNIYDRLLLKTMRRTQELPTINKPEVLIMQQDS